MPRVRDYMITMEGVLKLETNWTQWSERGQKKNEDEKGIQGSSVEEVKVSPSRKGWGGLQ